jgi:hypothetical protein
MVMGWGFSDVLQSALVPRFGAGKGLAFLRVAAGIA